MDYSSCCGKLVLVFVVFGLHSSTCYGLQCYECTYNQLDSSNSVLDFVLEAFKKISNEHCQMRPNEDDFDKVAIRNCPKPKEGYLAKCATLEGTVRTKIGALTVDYKTVERSCVEVRKDDRETTNKCHRDLPANGVARDLLSKTFSGLNVGDITFDGTTCYTQRNVPVPGLQCTRCTWNDVETSNVILNFFINGIEKLSSQNCKFENMDVDKYEVDLRNCPKAKEGYINKCGTITGKIKAKASILGTKWEVKYRTTNRDCIQVPEDAGAYTKGCHSDLPANGPVRALILETFEGINLGDVQFDGEACYEDVADTRIASKQTSSSNNLQTSTAILLTNCLVVVIAGFFL